MIMGRECKGFTLLELLVALAIFSLMSMMLYGSLTSMTETREQLQKRTDRFAEVQTFFRVIGRDISQIAARPIRDGYGDELPAVSKNTSDLGFEFTRNGWRNPAGRPRSSLQRVRYQLKEGKLIRGNWQVLDRDVESAPYGKILLDNVWALDITFVGHQEKIYKQWPPENAESSDHSEVMPRAVHVQIELEDWGRFDRLFLVNTGA